MRAGIGFDSHRFAEGRPLILGGVTIPYGRGLAGHSDADAVLHAVGDALLGAAALGDLGTHFPDNDPRYRNADSADLLMTIVKKIATAGFGVENVDVTVIAEEPKLSPYIDRMRANIAGLLNIPLSGVSVKGKTNEKMGWLGRGEGIACLAVVALNPASV